MWDVVVVGLGGVGSFALRAATQIAKNSAKNSAKCSTKCSTKNTPNKKNLHLKNLHSHIHPNMKILGIDQYIPGQHEYGSSHGKSRIYRHAYFEHPNYVPLIQWSTNDFEKLQRDTNRRNSSNSSSNKNANKSESVRLLEECGMLMIEDEDAATTSTDTDDFNSNSASLIDKCMESAKEHNIPVEPLSMNQLIHRYPQFNFNLNSNSNSNSEIKTKLKMTMTMRGLYEPKAGFVRPELSIGAALNEAKDNGAILWSNTSVVNLSEVSNCNKNNDDDNNSKANVNGNGSSNDDEHEDTHSHSHVEITLSDGQTIQSRKVIVAAGAWTAKLIPSWSHLLKVTRQIQAWVDVSGNGKDDNDEESDSDLESSSNCISNSNLYSPEHMPSWLLSTERLKLPFYGIPADPYSMSNPTHIKIALHGRDVEIDVNDLIYNDENDNNNASNNNNNNNNPNPPVTDDELAELQHALELFFTHGRNKNKMTIVSAKSCMYTMTPDEHFLLGSPKTKINANAEEGSTYTRCNNIHAAAGLSGHGFKMVPSLGRALADLALTSKTELEVGFLSPSRFGL